MDIKTTDIPPIKLRHCKKISLLRSAVSAPIAPPFRIYPYVLIRGSTSTQTVTRLVPQHKTMSLNSKLTTTHVDYDQEDYSIPDDYVRSDVSSAVSDTNTVDKPP